MIFITLLLTHVALSTLIILTCTVYTARVTQTKQPLSSLQFSGRTLECKSECLSFRSLVDDPEFIIFSHLRATKRKPSFLIQRQRFKTMLFSLFHLRTNLCYFLFSVFVGVVRKHLDCKVSAFQFSSNETEILT